LANQSSEIIDNFTEDLLIEFVRRHTRNWHPATINQKPAMKILHILDHSLPLQSGYAFRSQNILQTQRKRGWEPVALTSPKHEENWRGPWEKQEGIGGIPYYRTGPVSDSSIPFEGEIRLMIALNRRIHQVIKLEKPDLLHAHSPILNAIPALLTERKLGIPVVYEIRAFWEDAAVDHGTYGENSLKYKIVRYLETFVCDKVQQIAVLCNGLKDDLVRRGIPSEKVSVVSNGIDVNNFQICDHDVEYMKAWKLNGRKVIGFIGSFYRYEGLDLLINAFAHVSKNMPDSILLLVGGGEMEKDLRIQIERLNLTGKVIMPGSLPHHRIAGVYALTDILVYPRYSMRLTELVTPLKPLETMAMGKALIASDVGGHKELIKHEETGLLFSAGDVFALTESIKRLLSDHALRERLEKQGSDWVRQYHTWQKTTAIYDDIYSKALGKTISQ
jgi:PEP-CTERM/exosortase A-associated glycosyltransferase